MASINSIAKSVEAEKVHCFFFPFATFELFSHLIIDIVWKIFDLTHRFTKQMFNGEDPQVIVSKIFGIKSSNDREVAEKSCFCKILII